MSESTRFHQRFAERKLVRLRDFEFPQLVDCDEQWHILELSIVGSPQFLDFVEVGREEKTSNFVLDSIGACWTLELSIAPAD